MLNKCSLSEGQGVGQSLSFGSIPAPGNLLPLLFYVEFFQLQTTDLPPRNKLWNKGVGGEMCWVSRSSSPLPRMDFPSPGSPHQGFSLDIPDMSQITPWKRSPLCLNWADWELLAQIQELIQSWAARNTRGPGIIIYFVRMELIKF